ncbi:unnamed protein product [Phytomonas sp. EM1]|nr:unnamed protein product [Phytomonas sp. EM1]|eukprot:CCW59754.1 unnamed protein product [Phytomonas sp. isolate EM1]
MRTTGPTALQSVAPPRPTVPQVETTMLSVAPGTVLPAGAPFCPPGVFIPREYYNPSNGRGVRGGSGKGTVPATGTLASELHMVSTATPNTENVAVSNGELDSAEVRRSTSLTKQDTLKEPSRGIAPERSEANAESPSKILQED